MTIQTMPDPGFLLERAAGPDAATLSTREFTALTGVTSERVRTWQRRFGFPETTPDARGRRGFFAADVPRVLAVKQLIADGVPVAAAVRTVQSGLAVQANTEALEAAFGALPTPVVAISGPSPVEVVWANAAALATAPDGAGELPHPLPDRSATLRSLLIQPSEEPVWLTHREWFADSEPDPRAEPATPVRGMAWSAGSPDFVPAVLVVLDVPVVEHHDDADEDDVPAAAVEPASRREEHRHEHEWATAVGSARRALQRGVGRKSVDDALGALVSAGMVTDGLVLLSQGQEVRPVLSARGRPVTSALSDASRHELLAVTPRDDMPLTISAACGEELGLEPGCHAVAAPLVAAHVDLGYLVLVADAPPAEPAVHGSLVLAFATALAAAISRDRALRDLRRIRGV